MKTIICDVVGSCIVGILVLWLVFASDTNQTVPFHVEKPMVLDGGSAKWVATVEGSDTNIVWHFSDTNRIGFILFTNLATNWVIIETNRTQQRQMGYINTNRVLGIDYRGGNSLIILDVLGQSVVPHMRTIRVVPAPPLIENFDK